MTGYARAQGSDDRRHWVWEARSVNGRNLEVRCRVPQGLDRLENPARGATAGQFKRGNVSLSLTVTSARQAKPLRINRDLLGELATLVDEIRRTTGASAPSADGLLRVRGVIEEEEEGEETEEAIARLDKALLATLAESLKSLAVARAAEGSALSGVIAGHIDEIEGLCRRAAERAQVQIGSGCTIHPQVVIYDDVQIGDGCELHAGAVLHPGSRLGRGCVVHSNAVVGSEGFGFVPTASGWRKMPQTGLVVLEDGVEVGCGSTIDRPSVGETRIGAGTKIDNLVHIGHGVTTGKGCALAAQVGIAGGARLGNGVILAGQVGLANKAVMGDRSIASSKSGVHGEVAAGEVVSGYPAIPNRLWLRCSAAFNKLPELAKAIRALEKGQRG